MPKQRLNFDLILLGDPTVGKDTQALLLMKKYALKPVESGKYWRKLGKQKTGLSKLVRDRQAKSLPAPVEIIKAFLKQTIKTAPKNRDLLFVGAAKLKPEAMFLKKQLEARKRDFLVIFITVPEKEIRRRSMKRMRNIDDSKFVDVRIAWHKEQMGKTKRYYESLHKLKLINGNQSISKVTKDIEKALLSFRPTS